MFTFSDLMTSMHPMLLDIVETSKSCARSCHVFVFNLQVTVETPPTNFLNGAMTKSLEYFSVNLSFGIVVTITLVIG
jgi:hypothetical protein